MSSTVQCQVNNAKVTGLTSKEQKFYLEAVLDKSKDKCKSIFYVVESVIQVVLAPLCEVLEPGSPAWVSDTLTRRLKESNISCRSIS